jgi:hypothetical protein
MGPRAGLDGCGKFAPHSPRNTIPGPSNPYRNAIPTTLSRPTVFNIKSAIDPMFTEPPNGGSPRGPHKLREPQTDTAPGTASPEDEDKTILREEGNCNISEDLNLHHRHLVRISNLAKTLLNVTLKRACSYMCHSSLQAKISEE